MVVDKIEELPPSPNDDELRWKIDYAIYRDPFLSRYTPGGGMLWGHRHAFGGAFSPFGRGLFTGMEPAGDYGASSGECFASASQPLNREPCNGTCLRLFCP
jgi:hypothetical protein